MSQELDVGKAIDQGAWSAYQKWILLLVAFAVTFDGFDIQILGLSIPALMKEWGAARAAFAPVLALSLVGMAVGTVLGGQIGDRFGRRAGIVGSVLFFGVVTAFTALVNDVTTLGALRFLAGLGLGGTLPNCSALAAEMTPFRARARSVMLTILCVSVGAMLGGLVSAAVLPVYGWRALFVIGGLLPVAVAVLLFLLLPESPRYLARHAHRHGQLARLLTRMGMTVPVDVTLVDRSESEHGKISPSALFTDEYRRDTVALWLACFFTLLGMYSVLSWLPAVLSSVGLNSAQTGIGVTMSNLGGMIGVILSGLVMDRLGSRRLMLGLCAGVIVTTLYLRSMNVSPANVDAAIAMLFVLGFFLHTAQTGLFAVAANVYVSRIRSTGVGGAVGFGRIGAVLSSFLVPVALQWDGIAAYFLLIAATLLCTLIALAVLKRHVPAGGRK